MNSHRELCRSLYEIEKCISNAIEKCHPRSWDENHISYSWLEALRTNRQHFSLPSTPNFNVAWDAFKATGTTEKSHGDIAFLIKVTFSNNKPLLGVAFLEAKRMYENGNYTALNWPQLSFQASHSSNHRIVLYDDQRSRGESPLYGSACHHHCCKYADHYFFEGTHAHVVPTHHAITLKTKTRDLHSIGFSLSYQILCRYFYGLDLDFSTDLVQAVQNGAAGGVNFIMVAHAMIGREGEPSIQGILSDQSNYQQMRQE